jgi:auxin-responsive protein IAA
MKSSSAASRLRLKQEQASDGSKMQGSGLSSSLELRLGISSDNGGGSDPWLGVGVHPWSLASRQEKAALEQAHQRPPPQPVGWPPVGAFRKSHLAGAKAAEEPSKEKRGSGERPAASMFVKVNLEGCAVGRKVDLQAHRGYASLSRALQGMFHGFLSGQDSGLDSGLRRELSIPCRRCVYVSITMRSCVLYFQMASGGSQAEKTTTMTTSRRRRTGRRRTSCCTRTTRATGCSSATCHGSKLFLILTVGDGDLLI